MAAVEMSSLLSDDPQSAERRRALALQRHHQELGDWKRATLHPAEGASRLSKQDRSANIQAKTGRTVFAWDRHTLHRRQRSLHAKPAKTVGFRIKDADPGRNAAADFHRERHETRNDLRRSIRHLLRKV